MKTRTYLLALLGAASLSVCQAQNKITLQHNGQFTYYDQDSLQVALDDAQDGDVVLLPGGTIQGTFTLDRGITMLGAGINPDSSLATTPTSITGIFFLTENVSGTYFSGIHFLNHVYAPNSTFPDIHSIVFHRCYLSGSFGTTGIYSIGAESNGILFSECILESIYLNNARNCIIRNCIVNGVIRNLRDATIQFNTVLSTSGGDIQYCANCVIQGNVFFDDGVVVPGSAGIRIEGTSSSYASVSHNVFADNQVDYVYVSEFNNAYGADPLSLFTNYSHPFDFTDDLRLASGSPAIGAGPNGYDCGIYGGPSPWKEGGVPYNPHIQEQFVGSGTMLNGDLPVQVKVAAQDH